MIKKNKNKAEYSDDGKILVKCPEKHKGVFEIPASVETIGARAFSCCNLLTGVKIPNSVSEINDYAFAHCSNLSFVEFEKGSHITAIGTGAFVGCEKLESFEIPDGITEIKPLTFQECTYLVETVIPSGVTIIEHSAFCRCPNLRSVTIPNTVRVIEKEAFCSCSGLRDISIPDSVEEICSSAFNSCVSLVRVSFGSESKLKQIRKSAFINCYRLVSINIPESIETIEERAFFNCDSLKSLFLPAHVSNIGSEAAAMSNMDFTFYCEAEPVSKWHPQWNSMGSHVSSGRENPIAPVLSNIPRWWYEQFVLPKAVYADMIRVSSLDPDYDRNKIKEFISRADKKLYLRTGWGWRGTEREEVTKERMIELIDSVGDAEQNGNEHLEIMEYDDSILANAYIHNPF